MPNPPGSWEIVLKSVLLYFVLGKGMIFSSQIFCSKSAPLKINSKSLTYLASSFIPFLLLCGVVSKAKTVTCGVYVFIHCIIKGFKNLYDFCNTFNYSKYMKTCLHAVVSKFNGDFLKTRENVEHRLLEQSVNVFSYIRRQLDIHRMQWCTKNHNVFRIINKTNKASNQVAKA